MRVLIIEDERNAAEDMQDTLESLDASITVLAILDSIEAAVNWLNNNHHPDLIFSDIQLADGLCFEIFKKVAVTCPIVFCTAYDEYAIKAFDTNGIDYLLKPIHEKMLEQCLRKIENLRSHFSSDNRQLRQLLDSLQVSLKSYKTSFLISFKGKLIPLNIQDIAFFSLEYGSTRVYTFDGKFYVLTFKMEDLEQQLNPLLFYRANRQFLISFKAIKEVEPYYSRKTNVHLSVQTPVPVIVSKPRTTHFLQWLQNR